MIDIKKLMEAVEKIPKPTPEEARRRLESTVGDIWQITVCPTCGAMNWGWRLGCGDRNCRGFTHGHQAWRWQARSGAIQGIFASTCVLEHGKDFSFIDERPKG